MITRFPNKLWSKAKNIKRRNYFTRIYSKYKNFTMICQQLYIANLSVVDEYSRINGCVLECGTWRGGMIAGIAEHLGPGRSYYLFDSFQGLPPAKEIDGKAALEWQVRTDSPFFYENCTADEETARRAMALSGACSYQLIKGWFEQTLPRFVPPSPIAILRLDGDWYESTLTCLENLFPHLAPGGIVIVDDYYTWDGCSKAVHDYLSKSQSTARIRQQLGVCVIEQT